MKPSLLVLPSSACGPESVGDERMRPGHLGAAASGDGEALASDQRGN